MLLSKDIINNNVNTMLKCESDHGENRIFFDWLTHLLLHGSIPP